MATVNTIVADPFEDAFSLAEITAMRSAESLRTEDVSVEDRETVIYSLLEAMLGDENFASLIDDRKYFCGGDTGQIVEIGVAERRRATIILQVFEPTAGGNGDYGDSLWISVCHRSRRAEPISLVHATEVEYLRISSADRNPDFADKILRWLRQRVETEHYCLMTGASLTQPLDELTLEIKDQTYRLIALPSNGAIRWQIVDDWDGSACEMVDSLDSAIQSAAMTVAIAAADCDLSRGLIIAGRYVLNQKVFQLSADESGGYPAWQLLAVADGRRDCFSCIYSALAEMAEIALGMPTQRYEDALLQREDVCDLD